jgi:alanine racemase
MSNKYKTWLEIDSAAVKNNIENFRSILEEETRLWAVVKSNAYGHGLNSFSALAAKFGMDGFCVDSVSEALALRKSNITQPILVLGPTMANIFPEAKANNITITISSQEILRQLIEMGSRVAFHLKIDSGMHRQGFYSNDLEEIGRLIKNHQLNLQGIYTHYASFKNIDQQLVEYKKAVAILKAQGFTSLIQHTAATAAALANSATHLDAVRIGIGLYGLWPTADLANDNNLSLKPVLSWHTIISEIKVVQQGANIGYDGTEQIKKVGRLAICPIGYWHGVDIGLSRQGEVLVNGQRAKIMGRVSMDLTTIDVSEIDCQVGDRVTLIGGGLRAEELAEKINTIHYEILTRINPLIQKNII